MSSNQESCITSFILFSALFQALLVSGCKYEFPGCSNANCTGLDDPTVSDSKHGVYGDYFVNGVTRTSSGYGDNISTTGLADVGCYKLPAGYATDTVAVYPLTCNNDVTTAKLYPAADSLFYVKRLGSFTKISDCCKACHQANGCVFWRYTPYPKLPNGICFWTQTNLTQLYTTTTTNGVKTVTKSGVNTFAASTSNPIPAVANTTKNTNNGTYTCTVPLSVSGGNCRSKISSTVINDPHLTGAQGTSFDFNGDLATSFCLLSDKRLHVNMLLDGYLDARTEGAHALKDGKAVRSWIKELGVIYMADGEEHKLHLVARKSSLAKRGDGFLAAINFNGQPMGLPKVGEVVEYSGGARLTFLSEDKMGSYDVDAYSLLIPGLALISIRMRVAHALLRTVEDAQAHFNVGFDDLEVTPTVHGVLGQTYRANSDRQQRALKFSALNQLLGHNIQADAKEGEGFLDGKRNDYISSSVIATDCAFATFEGPYKTLDFVATSSNGDEDEDIPQFGEVGVQ